MERLKGKTILIGKEPGQGRLLVAIQGNGKSAAIGAPGSVPACVSRCKPSEGVAHAKITVDQTGNMTITNMKPQNVTFVNGSEIASKRVSSSNTVELGKDRFSINLPVVIETAKKIVTVVGPQPPQPPTNPTKKFNISHLKRVWDTYEKEIDRIAQQQQETGKKRMLPTMVGSLSGVASPILATLVAVNTLYITVPVAAISFGLYFINYKKKDTSYEERKEATERFTDEYVCPNPDCNKFLGNISYKLLKKQYSMHCPYCKSEYVEK